MRDFWDRWNLTVSHWLRDYVYVPLGGSRRGRHLRPRNVMVTMVVGGLWYGAGWNFALWGVVHGVYVIVEQAAAARAERREPTALLPTALTAPLHWFVTFHLVCLAFVVYRAGSVGARPGAGAGGHPAPGRRPRHPARLAVIAATVAATSSPPRSPTGPGPGFGAGAGRAGRRPGGRPHRHRRAVPEGRSRSDACRSDVDHRHPLPACARPARWPGDDHAPDDLDVLGMRWWWWVGQRTGPGQRAGGPGSRAGAGRSGGRRAEDDGTGDWTADDVVDVADDEPDSTATTSGRRVAVGRPVRWRGRRLGT